jgi:hypothetical protein
VEARYLLACYYLINITTRNTQIRCEMETILDSDTVRRE